MYRNVDTETIYNELKDFQKVTVDFAYKKLKKNGRYLVADEVGLGKTMVAKGIIAKMYDELKKKKKRIEIIYITTNQSIAEQNIATLKFGKSDIKATRLSLLATKLEEHQNVEISFRSFTVGTSVEFRGKGTGLREEREFLLFLLKKTGMIKGLWNKTLEDFFKQTASNIDTQKEFHIPDGFIEVFEDLLKKHYRNIKEIISSKEKSAQMIKRLRKLLVQANLKYLSPDLIIFDEFQRFPKLFTQEYDDKEIFDALISYKESKILLLSATPYKLLDCKDNKHYDEFYSLIEWLNPKIDIDHLKHLFEELEYKPENREKIENILKDVMCRTERTSFSADGMIEEKGFTFEALKKMKRIMKKYLHEYSRYRQLNIPSLTRYLKSSPSPLNYMKQNYKAKKEFCETEIEKSSFKINKDHPKLKLLQETVEHKSLQKFIWLPPLDPYVKARGVSYATASKILLFSHWDFAPDSIVDAFAQKNKKTSSKNYTDIKSFKKRERLLKVTTECKKPYAYKGSLYFSELIAKTRKAYRLSELDAKILLGSPANVIYRSILKYGNIKDTGVLKFYIEPIEDNKEDLKSFAHLFLHYLGQKEQYEKLNIPKYDVNKLEHILDYCIKHNIQAMMDEYIHLLTDSPRYKNIEDDEEKILYLLSIFQTVFGLRPNEIQSDEKFDTHEGEKRQYSRFAMRIAKSSMEVRDNFEKPLTADNIKTAFNSPFAPFVLATTSIGQEGLDFHKYCHQIWHWDLPSNPVDLEQREGRLHRYKNYAVRKNIANIYKNRCWNRKFEKAKKRTGCDFRTFWLFSDKNANQKIERVVPVMPLSRDESKYQYLLQQLSLYRSAIGRKRQSDIINSSSNSHISISLSPLN